MMMSPFLRTAFEGLLVTSTIRSMAPSDSSVTVIPTLPGTCLKRQ
jgi:hypothetical protein